MKLYHSTKRQILIMLPTILIGMLIGHIGYNYFNNRIHSFATLYPLLLGAILGSGIVMLISKKSRYDIEVNDLQIIGPTSYSVFAKSGTINLNLPFSLTRIWRDFPSLTYKISQGGNKITFSSKGLGREKTKKLYSIISKHLT